MSADILLLLLAFALLLKWHATWMFRFVTFAGAFIVIFVSWFLINLVIPDDDFSDVLLKHTALLTFTNWFVTAVLYAPICWIAHKRFLTKSEISPDDKFKKVVCPECSFTEEVSNSEVLSNDTFKKFEAHLDSKWEPYLICPECKKKFSF
jgi:hypothetical protein